MPPINSCTLPAQFLVSTMKTKIGLFVVLLSLLSTYTARAQVTPSFSSEIPVTINNLTFDAMEPFISPDGTTLFFNSLNDGITTSLYYATRINDSTFNYIGQVGGVNQVMPPHLDAVASLDSASTFFWISTMNWPTVIQNLHRGMYNNGTVTDTTLVYGDFYINAPGWIIMDGTISYDGNLLIYNNAYFNACAGLPCEARLGFAQKNNDSTFFKLPNSDFILANVNDTGYLVYAPHLTKNKLELYYTRLQKNTFNTEICVSTRMDTLSQFGSPAPLYSSLGLVPEAPTLTTDNTTLYYHKKQGNIFNVFMRYRTGTTAVLNLNNTPNIILSPNPAKDKLVVEIWNDAPPSITFEIIDTGGRLITSNAVKTNNTNYAIDTSGLRAGDYLLHAVCNGTTIFTEKFVIVR